jgi:hypothetical protein
MGPQGRRSAGHIGPCAETGAHTGRSPKDKYIVCDDQTEQTIWSENNGKMTPAQFARLYQDFIAHSAGKTFLAERRLGHARDVDDHRFAVARRPMWASPGATRRQNPLASTLVFSVFVIFDWEIHFPDSPAVHRARSRVRDDEGLGCFMFFILGFVTCSLRRTPRPPAELCPPGLINSIPAFSSAETNFIRESTLPRITPSLASMR